MLHIRLSEKKTVKKFVDFNLCFLLILITFCNIFIVNSSADETDATSSATVSIIDGDEISTECNTESLTEDFTETEETIETVVNEDVSDVFYFRFISVLLIIILFLMIISKLF